MASLPRRVFYALIPLWLLLVCVLAQPGCTCSSDPPAPPKGPIACRARTPKRPIASRGAPGTPTVAAGTIAGTPSVTSTGEATYIMPLIAPPGRAGVEPHLALTYDSAAGDGVL